MALFEKSLDAVKTFDSTIKTVRETFETERKRLLDVYKDPVKKIAEIKAKTDEEIYRAKARYFEEITADHDEVRKKIREFATATPPADFLVTLEVIKANGRNISEYEISALIEKYKGNYLASRAIHETLAAAGRTPAGFVKKPDQIVLEVNKNEEWLRNWAHNYSSNGYITALLLHYKNPVTALAEAVQEFLDGKFVVAEEV